MSQKNSSAQSLNWSKPEFRAKQRKSRSKSWNKFGARQRRGDAIKIGLNKPESIERLRLGQLRRWINATREIREAFGQTCSKSLEKYWSQLAIEEYEEVRRRMSVGKKNMSEEKKQIWKDKLSKIVSTWWKNLSVEERTSFEEKLSVAFRKLVTEGNHNWPKEKPVNNPTERIFDFFFAFIFLCNWNHNFKSLVGACREFELDFVSWLLRFGVEANEPYHDEEDDKIRDKFIEDSKELDFTYRYSTEYAITNMIDVIKTVYVYCNQQREKYKLWTLPILKFDDRWISYCSQMQELLKEWHSREKGRARFKVFRDKKREIDKQWLCLLEETSRKYSTNFAIVYQEILKRDLKLNFKNVISLWRA